MIPAPNRIKTMRPKDFSKKLKMIFLKNTHKPLIFDNFILLTGRWQYLYTKNQPCSSFGGRAMTSGVPKNYNFRPWGGRVSPIMGAPVNHRTVSPLRPVNRWTGLVIGRPPRFRAVPPPLTANLSSFCFNISKSWISVKFLQNQNFCCGGLEGFS